MLGQGPSPYGPMRVRVSEEPAGSFQLDRTGTLANFTDVPAIEGSVEFDPEWVQFDPGTLVQSVYDYRKEVLGRKGWTLSFQMPLAPTDVPAGNTVEAARAALGLLLKIVMGGEQLGTGTLASGAWAGPTTGDALVHTSLLPGGAIGWVDSDGILHARELAEKDGAELTTKLALPATPADADVIFAGATYYLAQKIETSAQFIVEGMEQDDRWLFLGGQGTVSLEFPLDGESAPVASFEFEGRGWLYGKDAATDLTGVDLALATYTAHEVIAGHEGAFLEAEVGDTTIAPVAISEVAFELAITNHLITAPHAPYGALRWLRTRTNGPAITGQFTTFFEALDRFGHRDDRDDMYLAFQIGTRPGRTVLITASTVQYGPVTPVNADEVGSETVQWKGRVDAGTSASPATDLSRSPFRIHLL